MASRNRGLAGLNPNRPRIVGRQSLRVIAASTQLGTATTASRRSLRPKREGNVEGQFWVDTSCIDCDLCRRMAPSSFTQAGAGSIVSCQPTTRQERVDSIQALLSCPTNSIRAETLDKDELKEAQQGLPKPVLGCPNIYHCGWHSEKSFSAAAYLIQRPAGNILVDSPRYNPILAKRLEQLGGVSVMFLSHRDDVADHARWARHFGCPRVIHATEVNSDTRDAEVVLQGEGPWNLAGQQIVGPAGTPGGAEQDSDATIIFTPGHTEGHCCLYYAPSKALLSGDHLSQDESLPDATPGAGMYIFTDFNWYSVSEQVKSVAKLKAYDFLTVLPGHGRIVQLQSSADRIKAMDALLSQHGYRG